MAEQQRNNIERADKIEAKHNQAQRSRFVVEHRNIFARTRMFVEIARLAKRNINNKKSTKTNRIKTSLHGDSSTELYFEDLLELNC